MSRTVFEMLSQYVLVEMSLLLVFTPLLTSLLFVLYARTVSTARLAVLTVLSLGALPAYLLSSFSFYVQGNSTVTNLGEWAHSGLFGVN